MSRSRRKTPRCGITTASTEKKDKRLANRAYRRISRHWVRSGCLEPMPLLREKSNVWSFDKDGKQWFGDRYPEFMRK